jgi:hypothetical protein
MANKSKAVVRLGPTVKHAGKVVFFLVPSKKLTPSLKDKIHLFLVNNYRAYTHESGVATGYWQDGMNITKDSHDKYLISLKESRYYQKLVTFVSELCEETNETCLFLTIGNDAYLVGNPSHTQSLTP